MGIAIRGHRDIVTLVAYVDAAGVGMHNSQPGIGGSHLPLQLPPLFTVQTATFQSFKSGHPALRHN